MPPLCKGRDAAVRSTVKTVHRRLFLAKAAKQLCCEPGVVASVSVSEPSGGRIVETQLFIQQLYNPPPTCGGSPLCTKGPYYDRFADFRADEGVRPYKSLETTIKPSDHDVISSVGEAVVEKSPASETNAFEHEYPNTRPRWLTASPARAPRRA